MLNGDNMLKSVSFPVIIIRSADSSAPRVPSERTRVGLATCWLARIILVVLKPAQSGSSKGPIKCQNADSYVKTRVKYHSVGFTACCLVIARIKQSCE